MAKHVFGPRAHAYFRPYRHANSSRANYLRWLVATPFRSFSGAQALAAHVDETVPDAWSAQIRGKRVLVVGTGPSLDRVEPGFFDNFDTLIYINFAIRRHKGSGAEYFFTTDIATLADVIEAQGAEVFEALGRDHCVCAPVFTDQWYVPTDKGRELLTWLRPDRIGWRARTVKIGPMRLPLALRYYPHQPDWKAFVMPPAGRVLPILDHTSALTAVLFAAINRPASIGLIGCDFSAGRAASVSSLQAPVQANVFAGAIAELKGMSEALGREGIVVTNHSWEV